MADSDSRPYVSLPDFGVESALWHGFGTRRLDWSGLAAEGNWRGLHIVALDQRHGDRVVVVDSLPENPREADALVTAHPGFLLVIQTADCLPVLLTDPQVGVVAAVHCGWRGTSLGILGTVVRCLVDDLGCRIENLQAALGPCIEGPCYEVGRDVRNAFAAEGYHARFFRENPIRQGKYLFDLRGANRHQLQQAGLTASQIFSVDSCTRCEKSLYSYRRDANQAGRLLNFIGRLP